MTKRSPVVEPSQLSREDLKLHANRLKLLSEDAGRVCEFLDTLSEIHQAGNLDPKGILQDALMTAAVIVYARSFTGNKRAQGKAVPKARIDLLPVSQEASLMELHDRVLDARDTAIAHSDWDRRATGGVENNLPGTVRMTSMAAGWENISEYLFRKLAHRVCDESRLLVFQIDGGGHPFK